MNTKMIDDLIAQIDDEDGIIMGDKSIFTTQEERDLLIDALIFYKEMQVL